MDLMRATWRKSSYSGHNGGECVEVTAVWRKSSYSGDNGGDCVEVAPAWRKSSRSNQNGGQCVEVANGSPAILVRDSKNPDGPRLAISPRAWHAFVTDLNARA